MRRPTGTVSIFAALRLYASRLTGMPPDRRWNATPGISFRIYKCHPQCHIRQESLGFWPPLEQGGFDAKKVRLGSLSSDKRAHASAPDATTRLAPVKEISRRYGYRSAAEIRRKYATSIFPALVA